MVCGKILQYEEWHNILKIKILLELMEKPEVKF